MKAMCLYSMTRSPRTTETEALSGELDEQEHRRQRQPGARRHRRRRKRPTLYADSDDGRHASSSWDAELSTNNNKNTIIHVLD